MTAEEAPAEYGYVAEYYRARDQWTSGLRERTACNTSWDLGGDERFWTARWKAYEARYNHLVPVGLSPSVFEGRGLYGEYFAHHARGRRDRQ